LRFLPREQQLHAQFGGLLWMPPGGIREHHIDWRIGTEPRHGRIPDHGFGLRNVPPDHHLGSGSV
jgi:hypothetical protein